MIVDALASVVIALWRGLIALLPTIDPPEWPGLSSLVTQVANIDTLIPVLAPIQLALAVLSAVVVFVVIRVVLVVVNIVWW